VHYIIYEHVSNTCNVRQIFRTATGN